MHRHYFNHVIITSLITIILFWYHIIFLYFYVFLLLKICLKGGVQIYTGVSRYFNNILHCNTKLLVKNLPRQSSRATCCRIKHTFTSPRYLFHPPPPFSFFHSDIFFSSPVLFRCTFSFTLFLQALSNRSPPFAAYTRGPFWTPRAAWVIEGPKKK